MKKFLVSLFAAFVLACLLCSCGGNVTTAEYKTLDGYETITLTSKGKFEMTHDDGTTSFSYSGRYTFDGTDIIFYGVNSNNKDVVIPLKYTMSDDGYLFDTSNAVEVKTYKKTDGYIYALLYNSTYDSCYLYVFSNEDGTQTAYYYDSTMMDSGEPEQDTYTVDGNIYYIPERNEYVYIPADGSDPSFAFFAQTGELSVADVAPQED